MTTRRSKQFEVAEEVGTSVANNFFEMFTNNPGPKFTWAEFPEICTRFAKLHIEMQFGHKIKQDVVDYAVKTAYSVAERLVAERDSK